MANSKGKSKNIKYLSDKSDSGDTENFFAPLGVFLHSQLEMK